MILIKNKQKKIAIDQRKLEQDTHKILDVLGYPDFDIGILLTTNATIRKYNKLYRNQDKQTDILSFPYYPKLKAGKKIVAKTEEDKNLGDIIMSLEYIQKNAPNWKRSFYEHMRVLLVHGICHLLGYDHIKDSDYKIMHTREQFLLKKLED